MQILKLTHDWLQTNSATFVKTSNIFEKQNRDSRLNKTLEMFFVDLKYCHFEISFALK